MSRQTSSLLLTLAAVHALGFACLAWAAAQPASSNERLGIRGYVLTPDGAPVGDGTVAMRARATRAATSIDHTGRFLFVPDTPGLKELQVMVPGYAPHRIDVDVPASRTVDLPIIRLSRPTYVRLRPVSATGEVISVPGVSRRSFNMDGTAADSPLDLQTSRPVASTDAEGTLTIGPLPRGVTMVALDSPPLARTQLPDLYVTGSDELLDVGTVMVDLGAVLHVDVVNATGVPLPGHEVFIEDSRPLSMVTFPPARTDSQGRATFQRLATGRYRVRTRSVGPCGGRPLVTGPLVSMGGRGTFNVRVVAQGTANLRLNTRFGALPNVVVQLSPDVEVRQPPPWIRTAPNPLTQQLLFGPLPFRSETACSGTTDANGVVVLSDFPPGPARIDVRFPNSHYMQRVTVPEGGQEIQLLIPDWLMQVSVFDAHSKRPVAGATVTWDVGAGRVEARTSGAGDALLEAVTATPGTVAVTAPGYEKVERKLSNSPEGHYEVPLIPAAPAVIQARVNAISGEPLPNAVVTLAHQDPADIERVAVADAKGIARFAGVGPGTLRLTASARGFLPVRSQVQESGRESITLTLNPGYRVLLSLELPNESGPQLIRVLSRTGTPVDDWLDVASDRKVGPSGHTSLGPLAPGNYVIELQSASARRQVRVQMLDRDVSITVR